MSGYVFIICVIALAVLAAIIIAKKKKRESTSTCEETESVLEEVSKNQPELARTSGMSIVFENYPVLSDEQDSQLVEVTDKELLARIDGVIPGTLQVIANTGGANAANQMVQQAGQLYRAVIPHGAVLDHSKALEGAVRGTYRDVANSIKGNANWVPVDPSSAKGLAAINATNAVMGVASMVVGQYYMTQINDQLSEISKSLDSIANFQDNEYKSKVYTLVAEVQKTSHFQLEIMENEDLRLRELQHLKELETKCAELLCQANLTLEGFANNTGVNYETYESLVEEAYSWYQYQQVLLQVMIKISELTYTLNIGGVSKEYSTALYIPYAKQAADVKEKLTAWHEKACKRLEIDVNAAWRKRQGVNGVLMGIPGLFNDELNYKAIPKATVQMIRKQSANASIESICESDLFHEDVQLIAKEGKLYYLPMSS